ncbi:uncharacterized protein LOC129780492 [Toxorhynchites rutilus septentrionalis]|uniref:uncharacterized protein LOC129780492 n=1 Tax=Toxorhynchites rutilus septentrionalis TaxID=329112 RepID=UPI002479D0CB|nr:uncharacterized protein LOC129780492 [Toxorhynchites rutilus septentrionalis]
MSIAHEDKCEKAIKAFSQQLQCVICLKLPTSTKICPYCSVLFCSQCIMQWLLTSDRTSDSEEDDVYRSNCPHCRKELRHNMLIRLTSFDKIGKLGPVLERISHETNNTTDTSDYNLEEDTIPKPKYTVGHFILKNFAPGIRPFRIYSQKVTDDLGSTWRLEVNPRGSHQTQNHWIGTHIQLVKGLEGKYEFIIEMLNGCPKRIVFSETDCKKGVSNGTNRFIDSRNIQSGSPIDLKFRFFVRPTSYEVKAKLQKSLLDKLKLQDERYKGHPQNFEYFLNDFSEFNKHSEESSHHRTHTDNLGNVWKFGLDTSDPGKILKFKLHLTDEGYTGLYDICLELDHEEAECTKKLTKQHLFRRNMTAIINMQIRWNQLDEFGFTHFEDDYLEIKVTIWPVHIDLRELQGQISDDRNPDPEYEDEEYLY